ncbi:MAG: hypothetical protein WBL93_01705 [Lutisporaceae bacterium]
MKLTRGLVVGSMLGMAVAMMINNQNTSNQSTSDQSMNNQNNTQNDNSKPHGSDIIITDIIR